MSLLAVNSVSALDFPSLNALCGVSRSDSPLSRSASSHIQHQSDINVFDVLEGATKANSDHLRVADSDVPSAKSIKTLSSEVSDSIVSSPWKVPLDQSEDRIRVVPPPEVEAYGLQKWKNCAVGYFLDKRLSFPAVDMS
ncbi:hypothetical protein TEA_015895 [Camellia sinensis var. sinensis]|uniref:Uncharacterized protein n=1 Tax=Camellia sinensis var. sinensis TaxID=542762 RepID=A0A4S4D963_CAMSN|nr:hypothetical protein TEA_015895 [Camellia sinensis var. sinensis]